MKELVELPLLPTRNSLSLTGAVSRAGSAIDADDAAPPAVQAAVPIRSPLKLAGPAVTLIIALTLSPGATGPGIGSACEALHPAGTVTPSRTSVAGAAP